MDNKYPCRCKTELGDYSGCFRHGDGSDWARMQRSVNNLARIASHIHSEAMKDCQHPRGSLGRAVCEARGCHCRPIAKSGEEGGKRG